MYRSRSICSAVVVGEVLPRLCWSPSKCRSTTFRSAYSRSRSYLTQRLITSVIVHSATIQRWRYLRPISCLAVHLSLATRNYALIQSLIQMDFCRVRQGTTARAKAPVLCICRFKAEIGCPYSKPMDALSVTVTYQGSRPSSQQVLFLIRFMARFLSKILRQWHASIARAYNS
jgi:hypothetical protein